MKLRRKMGKPRLLDLFCCAGGAGMGYHRAGFEVVGVDIAPQKRYPFEFIQADALEYVAQHGHEFDAIHASPPCQAYSEATPMSHRGNHPDLIAPTREALRQTGKPYVIENVENARHELIDPMLLCGSMFGLHFYRHRYFEMEPHALLLVSSCNHLRGPVMALIDGQYRTVETPVLCTGGGDGKRSNRKTHRPRQPVVEIRWAMDLPWMTQQELSEAIPPAYTEYIGRHLIELL
jgi:DNA (cytosine-5)-methyltransferase 1